MKSWLPMGACEPAVKWVGKRTLAQAWAKCERADWMLCLAAKLAEHEPVVLCACVCVRTGLRYVRKGEGRPLAAIEAAEKWARNPTEKNRLAALLAAQAAAAAESAWAAAESAARAAARAAQINYLITLIEREEA